MSDDSDDDTEPPGFTPDDILGAGDLPAELADQLAKMADFAGLVAGYHRALIARGLGPYDALQLAIAFQAEWIRSAAGDA